MDGSFSTGLGGLIIARKFSLAMLPSFFLLTGLFPVGDLGQVILASPLGAPLVLEGHAEGGLILNSPGTGCARDFP